MPDIALTGCRTRPLMSYLKALGVLRLVAEQADPDARLWWKPARHAVLGTTLDPDALAEFFLERYEPTPITSPWNSGAGYHNPGKNGGAVAVLRAVEISTSDRLGPFREVIATARDLIRHMHPEGGDWFTKDQLTDAKASLLERWRARAPESALPWLDAAWAVGDEQRVGLLLGSGGGDGRNDFSKAYMAALADCVPFAAEGFSAGVRALSHRRLQAALVSISTDGLETDTLPIGMFDPAGAGLPNSGVARREPSPRVNPWDLVLMFEGAVLFGSGVARRLGADGALFPFTARSGQTGVGRSLATGADAALRGESWMPVWASPVSLRSLRRLLAEGRLQDDRTQARTGRAAARAVATLGVDRGVDEFERYSFVQRFGLNYVAVPVGRVRVLASRDAELLRAADPWLDRVRRVQSNALRAGLTALDQAAARMQANLPAALEEWLLALAALELRVSRTERLHRGDDHVPPIPDLPGELAVRLVGESGSAEARLAAALAKIRAPRNGGDSPAARGLREVIEPVVFGPRGRPEWLGSAGATCDLRRPDQVLVAVAVAAPPARMDGSARLADLRSLLGGELDISRIARLAFALSLCRPIDGPGWSPARAPRGLDRVYALTYLASRAGIAGRPGAVDVSIPTSRALAPLLAGARTEQAIRLGIGHLRDNGLAPFTTVAQSRRSPTAALAVATALAFPLHPDDRPALEAAVLTPVPTDEEMSPHES